MTGFGRAAKNDQHQMEREREREKETFIVRKKEHIPKAEKYKTYVELSKERKKIFLVHE
jgi:hypothetical protein